MAATKNDLTQAIQEGILEAFKEIIPEGDWPDHGEIHVIAFLHQGTVKKAQGQLVMNIVYTAPMKT